jgi:purine-binding chemotaxis protein CheW
MTATRGAQQVVTFSCGDDHFAADIFTVERVLRYAPPRPLPDVPEWLRGVVDYRDRVVPVVDLRRRLALPPADATSATRTLVCVVEGAWVGLVVDAVHEVAVLDPAVVEPPPPLYRGLTKEYVQGIARTADRPLVLLDVGRLLSSQERLVLARAVAGEAG